MKKINLLLLLFIALVQLGFGQQIVYQENFTGTTIPAAWSNLDQDLLAGDVYFTGQSVFIPTEWSMINFTGPGLAAYSLAEFASTPGTANDWLFSPQVTLLANPSVSFEQTTFAPGINLEVLVATSLAGATPAPSDFTLVQTITPTGSGLWETEITNLSAYANQSVYIAIRNFSVDATAGNQVKLTGIKNFRVLEPAASDLAISAIVFDETKYLVDGLIVEFASFCDATAVDVMLEVSNQGVSPITTFDATFTNGSSLVTETFTIPSLAPGLSTMVSFATQANVDTFDAYFIDAWVSLPGDNVSTNDSSSSLANLSLMITPEPDTITLSNPFETSFEVFDGTNVVNFDNAYWTSENANNDAQAFRMVNSPIDATDGDYALAVFGDNNTAFSGGNDWAFSPCIYFEQTKTYEVSFKQKVGVNVGVPISESLAFHLCAGDNAASSVENIGSMIVNDTTMTVKTFTFSPATSGVYNFGLHKNTTGVSWWLWIDEFSISEIIPCSNGDVSGTLAGTTQNLCVGDSVSLMTDGTEFVPAGEVYGWFFQSNTSVSTFYSVTGSTNYFGDLNASLATPIPFGSYTVTGFTTDGGQASFCGGVRTANSFTVNFLAPSDPICQATICDISSVSLGAQSACDTTSMLYSQDLIVTYVNAPATGTLDVNGQSFAITGSPQTVSLSNLVSNGLPVNLSVSFSSDVACTFNANAFFTAPVSCQCSNLALLVDITENTSCGVPNGAAIAMVLGGTGTYSYVWNPSVLGTGATVTNLAAGSYTVAATDVNGCSVSRSVVVNNTAGANAEILSFSDVNCFNENNGSIVLTTTDGTAPFSFVWSDQSTASIDSTRSDLAKGDYSVVVYDADSCTVNLGPVSIGEPTALAATASATMTSASSNTGTATAVASGGTAPYSFVWNDAANQNNDVATNLAEGTYICTITDANMCVETVSVKVSLASSIEALTLESLSIFPNPSSGLVNVLLETKERLDFDVKVMNTIGKVVYTKNYINVLGLFNEQIDLSKFSNGVYFIELSNKDAKSVERITISK